jgi:hypothetical protein
VKPIEKFSLRSSPFDHWRKVILAGRDEQAQNPISFMLHTTAQALRKPFRQEDSGENAKIPVRAILYQQN